MSKNTVQYDAIVAGVGGMGSAALYNLAARGWKVLGLDKHDIPNNMGSSHGNSRMIRLSYHEDPSYVTLMRKSYELWDKLQADTNQELLITTGSIRAGYEHSSMFTGSKTACDIHSIPYEILEGHEVNKRFPGYSFPNDILSVYQPDGGFLVADKCISSYLTLADELGADIHGREPILEWHPNGDTVEVVTTTSVYTASRLILTAGPWISKLLSNLGPLLETERQVVGWFQTLDPKMFNPDHFPVFGLEVDIGRFYGFPSFETPGVKLGKYNHLGEIVDPDIVSRDITTDDQKALSECLEKYFPKAHGPVMKMETCMFTNTPDGHFIIDTHPDVPQVSIAAGFSGHGFKFCGLVGEILADLAQNGHTEHNIDLFKLGRFS